MTSTKVIVAEFGMGTSFHFDFENLLQKNNIEFETQTRTVAVEGSELDVISFLVPATDIDKAKELKKQLESTKSEFKAYPKFMKIGWIGLVIVALFITALFLLSYYKVI